MSYINGFIKKKKNIWKNNAINNAKQMSCILGGHTWKKKILSNKCGKTLRGFSNMRNTHGKKIYKLG